MPIAKRRRSPTAAEPKMCHSVEEVIEALGDGNYQKGKLAVMAITKRNQNFVINWRNDGLFASNTYKVLTDALAMKGRAAPPSLWRMLEP
jgi:hypothetical protein